MAHPTRSSPGHPGARDLAATVAANERLGEHGWVITLRLEPGAPRYEPGRFLMLATTRAPASDPLLRRPFSVLDETAEDDGAQRLEILYEVIGRGTALMAAARPGDRLAVLGPLGRGFTDPPADRAGACLIVAGGVGVAPFPFLVRRLRAAGREVVVLLGARTADRLHLQGRLGAAGATVRTITDAGDGADGAKGLVTDLLADEIERRGPDGIARAFVCGPEPMMRATAGRLRAAGVPSEISMERRMACGWGVCWTCVCRQRAADHTTSFRPTRTCLSGPVIALSDLPEEEW